MKAFAFSFVACALMCQILVAPVHSKTIKQQNNIRSWCKSNPGKTAALAVLAAAVSGVGSSVIWSVLQAPEVPEPPQPPEPQPPPPRHRWQQPKVVLRSEVERVYELLHGTLQLSDDHIGKYLQVEVIEGDAAHVQVIFSADARDVVAERKENLADVLREGTRRADEDEIVQAQRVMQEIEEFVGN